MQKEIISLDGKFIKEEEVLDTYFNQAEGRVLKLQEMQNASYVIALKSENGGFKYLKNEKVTDLKETKEKYTKLFGIQCVQKKHNWYYSFHETTVEIIVIENVGEFLVTIGENITCEFVTKELKIKNPDFIHVPFSQL